MSSSKLNVIDTAAIVFSIKSHDYQHKKLIFPYVDARVGQAERFQADPGL